MSKKVYIVDALRTPIGSFGGSLSSVPAVDLAATVISALLERTGVPADAVDEVLLGNVLQAGQGQNPARQAAVKAGIPVEKAAMTLNIMCGSGLRSVADAATAIRAGEASLVIAGGTENMSRAPFLMTGIRDGVKMGHQKLLDSMIQDGLWDCFNDYHMGMTAENLADRYEITRDEQDAFALASQTKAAAAIANGTFADEIVPVMIPQRRKDPIVFDTDEYPRRDADLASFQKLRACFKKDGTVTPGNSSGINDGAALVMVADEETVKKYGLRPLAEITGYVTVGVEPEIMGIGPVPATKKALAKAGWALADIELIEANEAFAVQSLAVGKELEWNSEIVNVNGGAIALGHPIGASGCRILVTLLHEMARRKVEKGLATLCVGGGMGVAMCVKRS